MSKLDELMALAAEYSAWGSSRDALESSIKAVLEDAERYQWLRERIKVREERSMAGSCRDSIYVRVGQSFFDTPTRGDKGYVEKEQYQHECKELDAAIDAARKA